MDVSRYDSSNSNNNNINIIQGPFLFSIIIERSIWITSMRLEKWLSLFMRTKKRWTYKLLKTELAREYDRKIIDHSRILLVVASQSSENTQFYFY